MTKKLAKYAGFDGLEDLVNQFQIPSSERPTERSIVHAFYNTPPYEGYAHVVFTKGRKVFEVSGSHCSCYGLEGQWSPEETSWDAIAMRTASYDTPACIVEEAQRRLKRKKS